MCHRVLKASRFESGLLQNITEDLRHALSSIASSTACECSTAGSCEALRWAALRGAHSLEALPREAPLLRAPTARSLAADAPVATVCGDPVFNGTDESPRAEDSPLLRETSLTSKLERARRKAAAPEASYIEFYKRCRSLENVADGKAARKTPRFTLPWLLGIFGAPQASAASLHRESAV